VTFFLKLAVAGLLLGNIIRLPLVALDAKSAPLLLSDLLVGVLALAVVVHALQRRSLQIETVGVLALLFAGVGGAAALVSTVRFDLAPLEVLISLAYLARWILYFGVFTAVLQFVKPQLAGSVVRTLEAVILTFAAFGIFQSIFLPGFAQMVHPGEWDEQGMRLVSTFLDPNLAGMFLLVGLFLSLGRISFGAPVTWWKPALLFVAVALTLSRSAAVALLAGLAVIALFRGHSRSFAKLAALGAGVGILLLPAVLVMASEFARFSVDGSAAARFVSWIRAWIVFTDNPVMGIGFNTYGFVQERYGFSVQVGSDFALDGGLLFVLVMTGVVGLALYLGIISVTAARCRDLWRNSSDPLDRGLGLGVLAATVALLAHSVFVNSLLMTHLMATFWLLWGVVAVRSRALRVTQAEPSEGR
jgi:putative inorganic carbon (hco3(-)) transporter